MPVEVTMPVITGQGEDGVVTAWMVDEGGRVDAGQLIAEVQAEKVAQEVHAPAAGVVRGRVGINEPVAQGLPICRIFDENTVGEEQATPVAPAAAPATIAPAPSSPAARRLARELGIDLETVTGSGPEGRITEADVRAAGGGGLTGLRAVIAHNMRESVRTTAAVTLTTTVDVTATLPDHITAWIVHQAARALAEHPALNGTRDGDRFVRGEKVSIGLAIQTEDGLLAPVIRDPASKSVESLAEEITQLAQRARAKQLVAGDFEGGTFSLSNLGALGIDAFTPIINPPQIAILGVGAVRTVAGFENGAVVPRRHLTLSLTFDHSFVDGAPAAEFLADLRQRLQG